MPSRRRLAPIAALVLAFGLGFWWTRIAAVEPAAILVASAPPLAEPATQAAAPSPLPTVVRRTVRTETEIAAAGIVPEIESITTKTADDYVRRARFPRASQPIEDGVDPIIRDREVTKGKSVGPEGSRPTLMVWPERTGFEAPSPIVLHASLVHDDHRVDPRALVGEIRTQQGGVLAALDFHDDGGDGDATANDRIYTATVVPGPDRAPDFKGAQLVEVHAETKGGEERIATTGFLYSLPLAHLTGRYRDEIVDGNLVVSAEVQVDATGRFHLEATLAGQDGTLIGWAQNALVLDAGTAWIPLTYWGLMFHERQVDGPYVLASAALSTTGEMPNQKNDVAWNPYVTKPYAASAFSDKTYDDADLLDAAARLRAEAPVGGLEAAR